MKKCEEQINRRQWLIRALIGSVLVGLGGIFLDVCLSAGRFSPARWRELAPVSSIHEGVVPFAERKVAVVRRQMRLAAISLECTHLGCLLHTQGEGFFCPCHGSEFGPLGEVYSGPATKPLKWHALRIHRGRLWVQVATKRDRPQWLDMDVTGGAGRKGL